MNRSVRLQSSLALLCAAAAVSQPLRASIPPALSAISSEDFVTLDVDGDGKLSRSELRRAPGLLLRLDDAPDPDGGMPAPALRLKRSAVPPGSD